MKKKLFITFIYFLFCNIGLASECADGDCINGKGTLIIYYENIDELKKIPFLKDATDQQLKNFIDKKMFYSMYEGEFKNGKYHGKGISSSGCSYMGCTLITYRGEYKDGKKNGFGSARFENGDSYEGEYKDGLMHGKGVYEWSDGKLFSGDFKNGKIYEDTEKYLTVNDLILDINNMINKEIKVKGWLGFQDDKMYLTHYHSLEALFSNQTGIEVTMKNANNDARKHILENCQTSLGECSVKFEGKLISVWGDVKMSIFKIIE